MIMTKRSKERRIQMFSSLPRKSGASNNRSYYIAELIV